MNAIRKTKLGLLCGVLFMALLAPIRSLSAQEVVDSQRAQSDSLSPAEIIAIAKCYAEHKWRASADNVLHGRDDNGNEVDTPDESYRKGGFAVDAENIGIPYQWGGFSSIEEFEQGIRAGKLAGHLPKKGSSRASPQAVGVDCSGLVSRCWGLPRKHSTRSLGNLCYELKSYDELQPGDIINSFDGHVVLFESFADSDRTKLNVYEAGRTRVEKNVYPVAKLKANGFKPLRYMPLDPRWSQRKLSPANASLDPISHDNFKVNANEIIDFADLKNPLLAATSGDWSRYKLENGEETVRSITRASPQGIVIRNRLSRNGKSQLNERETAFDDSLVKTLIDFGGFDQDFGELKLVSSQVEAGQFEQGEHIFEARQIKLELKTTLLIRQINYPVTIKLDCLISEELPVCGVITARYDIELKSGKEVVGKSFKQFDLLESFKG